jgi:hypothetical protein
MWLCEIGCVPITLKLVKGKFEKYHKGFSILTQNDYISPNLSCVMLTFVNTH